MDVLCFLKERTAFIRQLYQTGAAPYVERKRKIEANEAPFVPPYSEDDEPPFLEEWLEADESLHVLAYMSVSMLAAALHLYFETWRAQLGIPTDDLTKQATSKGSGWFIRYKALFGQRLGISFSSAPVNHELLEEIALARNRIEHPSFIVNQKTRYSASDLAKLRHPFFVDQREAELFSGASSEDRGWLFQPSVRVAEDQLRAAISEVERFAEWCEAQITNKVYGG